MNDKDEIRKLKSEVKRLSRSQWAMLLTGILLGLAL
jgi:hypothetical protein